MKPLEGHMTFGRRPAGGAIARRGAEIYNTDLCPPKGVKTMTFQVRRESRPTSVGLDGTVYVLEKSDGKARAEVAPSLGFNCYRWLPAGTGGILALLYCGPH